MPPPLGRTIANPPALPTENVYVLFAPAVIRVHAPVPFCAANHTGTSVGSQFAKLNARLPLPPGAGVT